MNHLRKGRTKEAHCPKVAKTEWLSGTWTGTYNVNPQTQTPDKWPGQMLKQQMQHKHPKQKTAPKNIQIKSDKFKRAPYKHKRLKILKSLNINALQVRHYND